MRTDPPITVPPPGRYGRGHDALVAKLSRFASLSNDDIGVLEALCSNEERVDAGVSLAEEGYPPPLAFVITRGLVCRYRFRPDGRRQILTFLIPGDFFDLHVFLLRAMDHSIVTIAPTRLARVERDRVIELVGQPRIRAALWWSAMQEDAMQRERIVMLGRGNARARIAYLFCEFLWRYRVIGLSEDRTFRLPLTQTDIADTLGLTAVHVNRVLQGFRREGLISLANRRLTLHQIDRLQDLAGLTPDYLHLTGLPAQSALYVEKLVQKELATRHRDTVPS